MTRFKARHLIFAALAVLLLAAAVVLTLRLVAPGVERDAQADRAGAADAIVAAKAAVQTRAPDAINMTYGKVTVNWIGDTPAVCGSVDIEEPQDSFDGPERFIWVDGQTTIEEYEGTDAVSRQWDTVCKSV